MVSSDVTLLTEPALSSMGDLLICNLQKCTPEYKTFVLNVSSLLDGEGFLGGVAKWCPKGATGCVLAGAPFRDGFDSVGCEFNSGSVHLKYLKWSWGISRNICF